MAEFVQAPNLPDSADIVIIGEKYAEKLEIPLKKLGIHPVFLPDNPDIDSRLSGHADLSIFHAGGERVYLAPYLRESGFDVLLNALSAELIFCDVKQSPKYPEDAQLNIAAVGDTVIYNPKASYMTAVNYLQDEKNYCAVSCKQGYAKCSTLVVNERSLITQDVGIARAATKRGLDVLQITPGYVALDGFSCGFIGGTGFKINRGELAFTGLLDRHPDKARIIAFLKERDITPVYLTDEPIFDIGSAITLTEKT